jgi:hypothetical protein
MFHLKRQPRRCRSIRPIHYRQDCHCSASTHAVPAHGHCTIKCCLRSFRKRQRQPPLSPVDNEGTSALPTSVVAIVARVIQRTSIGPSQLLPSRTGRAACRLGQSSAGHCFESILLKTFGVLAIPSPPPQSLFFPKYRLATWRHSPVPLNGPINPSSATVLMTHGCV